MFSIKEILGNVQDTKSASAKDHFSFAEAKRIGDTLGISWDRFGVEQFRMGLSVELEHGRRDPATDVTHDGPIVTGKIALAHLNEIPDYYTRLAVMEGEAEQAKSTQRTGSLWEVHPTERKKLPIVLFAIIFAAILVLEVRQARTQSS
jgi:hypothetical protein